MTPTTPYVEIDGHPPAQTELVDLLLGSPSHYSSMQVRGGGVRGLALHLARLRAAHRELFGTDLDVERVRRLMRRAVHDRPDSYLRVSLDEPEPGRLRVMTVVRAPVEPATAPVSLLPVPYVRPFAHVKHVGTFGQNVHARRATAAGYDEALLVTPDGLVCETHISNVGFLSGDRVVWPDAPALVGITRQLLDSALREVGVDVTVEPVPLASVGGFDGAFTTNSIGVVPVGRIGEYRFPGSPAATQPLIQAYERVPKDPL